MALSLGLNNNNNYMDHGDITAVSSAATLTLMYWMWRANPAVSTCGIEKLPMSFFEMSGDTLVTKQVSSWTLSTSVYTVPNATWTHHAFVFDGALADADRVKLYSNATLLALTGSTAGTTLPDTTGNGLQVGQSNVWGYAAHLRMWSVALTQAEILLEMHRYWAARKTTLVLDAPYDDQIAARDYSVNGNHGTLGTAPGAPTQQHGPPVSYGGKVLVTG